ncbi:hypothetical protein AB431_27020 [Mycobacterium sp. EPa45]|nr:hypothetical protein AB431_27020 [Mycobacterium sp. EPa45]
MYSEYYSAYAGCASARPPGADTRRPPPPPPLAGVVPFSDKEFLAIPANSTNVAGITCVPSSCRGLLPRSAFIHNSGRADWCSSAARPTVGW